jgi:hypothetical protein
MWKSIYGNVTYVCEDCGGVFEGNEVVKSIRTGSYESDYGVSNLFSNRHYYSEELDLCPYCLSARIYEYEEEEEEDDE